MAKATATTGTDGQVLHTRTTGDSTESQAVVLVIDGTDSVVDATTANGLEVDVTRVQGTVAVADSAVASALATISAAVDQLEGYTDTLEALLGSAAATASAAATTSGQLVAGAGKLVSFSARETAGAAAVFRLRDGSGGTILATVSLAANESVRDTFTGGITYSTSLYLERVSGTTEVTAATR